MILRFFNYLVDHISGFGLRIAEWMTIFGCHVIHHGGRVTSPVRKLRRRRNSNTAAVAIDLEEEIEDFFFGEPDSQELQN